MQYHWVKYIGETIYTKDVYKYGWYTQVSDTFITHGKIYRLLKPVEESFLTQGGPARRGYSGTLYIEDDILLSKPLIVNDYERYAWDNYTGERLINEKDIEFIPNREVNLDRLIT